MTERTIRADPRVTFSTDNKEATVQLPAGKFVLKRCNAEARNEAMAQAETPAGVLFVKMTRILLPLCVREHPFGALPLTSGLGQLDPDEYDLLTEALSEIIRPRIKQDELEKK